MMLSKLLLVDDHQLFIEGLQYLLITHGIKVAGIANNGKEAISMARTLKPDIILMDIKMPELSGLEALGIIKAEMPETKIVILTTSDEEDDIIDAVKYGASGYLIKSINGAELVDRLEEIEKGETYLSSSVAEGVLREFSKSMNLQKSIKEINASEEREEKLTERQLEILEMVARGITYKEAGEILGLTERTIKYHMGRILEVLHLENKAQAISYSAKIGLIGYKD